MTNPQWYAVAIQTSKKSLLWNENMLANGFSDWEPDRETSIAPQPLKITSLQPSLEAGQA